MSLIVQKFGGTSVANTERLKNVARIVTDTKKKGNQVVVVVSAQGDTTDEFEMNLAKLLIFYENNLKKIGMMWAIFLKT